MNGLSNSYSMNNNIMNKWYRLFEEQNSIHSDQKYEHWENVKKCGFPNIKDKKWKYIPLNKLYSHTFINTSINHNIKKIDRDNLSLNFTSYRLVFVNGFFSKQLSDQDLGPWKIKIVNRNTKQILPSPIQPEVFLYLIECLSYETVCISLPNNKISEIPLYLLHINQGSKNKKTLMTFNYRHHIKIHKNSYGKIIEHYTNANKNSYFTGSRITIIADSNSRMEHTKLSFESRKSYHLSYNDIYTSFNSIIQSNIFNIFGSHFQRQQINALLNKKQASISLNSLLLPLEKDINDISTYIEHNQPGHNTSKQIHKIIASNQGQGIFKGIIQVNKKALKIDGKMLNKNLLLHKSSKIYSMPQLEIYSDDVTCNHGATIGYIDYEQIFYLCTRGITYQDACQMLIYAFSVEIIENVNNNYIEQEISDRINNLLKRKFYNGISYKKNSI